MQMQPRNRIVTNWRTPFFPMGDPIIVPVGPDTAADEIPMDIPLGATTYQWTNANSFSVRFRGTIPGSRFVAVTTKTGRLWLPGTQGIRTTLSPYLASAMSVDGPYAASNPEQKAGRGFVELQYGVGGGL